MVGAIAGDDQFVRGPAYPVLGSSEGVAELNDDVLRGRWYYHKTLWAVSPGYRGLLIRGVRLDRRDPVRFHLGGAPSAEIRWPPQPGGARVWRYAPTATLLPGPGCFAFQIDGLRFSKVITFAAGLTPPAAVRLPPLPPDALRMCRRVQARSPLPTLCPRRLPQATTGWPGANPPELVAEIARAFRLRGRGTAPAGVSFTYSAPVEPTSGPDWRKLLWHNRPRCFLHFEVFWQPEPRELPPGVRPAVLAGKRGLFRSAGSHGLGSGGYWWDNHVWFFWRERYRLRRDSAPFRRS